MKLDVKTKNYPILRSFQVTEYLHVKSFKRKYPDCPRRLVDMEEVKTFLL